MSESPQRGDLKDETAQIRTMTREFAEKEIKPHLMEYDESQEFPREIFSKMAELGFLGITFPISTKARHYRE